MDFCHTHIGGKQRECRQRCRANRKAFADGGSSVAHRIKAVGAGADFFGQLTHLGDTARVIGHRAVGIYGELDTGVGQHTHGGNCDAVQASKVISAKNGCSKKQDGPHR